jgi:hypothetical protein
MPTVQPDAEIMVRHNPQVRPDAVRHIDALMAKLDRLGIEPTRYRLACPFSLSLKSIKKSLRGQSEHK